MFNGLLDQIGQFQGSRRLEAVHRRSLTASNTLKEMLQLGIERFNRRCAHLFDESIVPVEQFTVIS